MALVPAAALLLFALLVLVRRRPAWVRGPARIGAAALAVLAAAAAVLAALRGAWLASLALAGLAAYLGPRGGRRPVAPSTASSEMSLQEARSVLGVGPGADKAEILAAYRRIMRVAHPDQGGTAGLAAKVNAARDRLNGAL